MNEDSFERARKTFFGINEVSSVSSDAERDFEKILELASEILQRQRGTRKNSNRVIIPDSDPYPM